jgi:hypothetical protein
VSWVADEAERQGLVQDESTPFFSTSHFDGHPSVLVRAVPLGGAVLTPEDRIKRVEHRARLAEQLLVDS